MATRNFKATSNSFNHSLLSSKSPPILPSCVVPKGQKSISYNEFMDLPKYDKHCGSVDEKDIIWNECNICDKIIICRKGHSSTIEYLIGFD